MKKYAEQLLGKARNIFEENYVLDMDVEFYYNIKDNAVSGYHYNSDLSLDVEFYYNIKDNAVSGYHYNSDLSLEENNLLVVTAIAKQINRRGNNKNVRFKDWLFYNKLNIEKSDRV